MSQTRIQAIGIAAGEGILSKGQKAFNSQIKQIEKLRAQLAAWEAAVPSYLEKYTRELLPLVEMAKECQLKMVQGLDVASMATGLSKRERQTIGEIIVALAGQLIGEDGKVELKALYNKHSRSDYDKEEAANLKGFMSVIEDALGVDLGDVDAMGSPEEIMRRAQAHMDEMQAQDELAWQAQEELRARRKKSKKQQEKEAQQEAAAEQISQSIREVYRKLASALHPDREPDAAERTRKTALMQRVNQAYEKRNLLRLLELQLELEHIDNDAIARIDEGKLRHYNAILKEQIGELKMELIHVQGQFRAQFGIHPSIEMKPETVLRGLNQDIIRVRQANREAERDLRALADVKTLKAWLKSLRRRSVDDLDFDDCPF
ncbi:MAG: J domain-containing protein [Sulfuritalea sp.]|nr:J domain-containing protein [Sulfuritalea sp.]